MNEKRSISPETKNESPSKKQRFEKKPDSAIEPILQVNVSYFIFLKELLTLKEKNPKAPGLEVHYAKLIENRCVLGDLEKDSNPADAIKAYKEALEYFRQWNEYASPLKNPTDESIFISLSKDSLNQKALIHYNLFAIISNKRNLSDLQTAVNHLETAMSHYKWLVENDVEKKVAHQSDLDICIEELSEINQVIDQLQKMENEDGIEDFNIYSSDVPQTSIYKFEHALFVLKAIENNHEPDKITIKCRDNAQMQAIQGWLDKVKTLRICNKKLGFETNDECELITQDKKAIFHLVQWQKTHHDILSALQNNDWQRGFKSISGQYSNDKRRLFTAKKRLKLIEKYHKQLSSNISDKDRSLFENAYEEEKASLTALHIKAQAVSEKKRKRLANKETVSPASDLPDQNIEVSSIPQQEVSDDVILLDEPPKSTKVNSGQSEQPKTNNLIFFGGKSFLANVPVPPWMKVKNQRSSSVGLPSILNPTSVTNPPEQTLATLASVASTVSKSQPKLTRQQLENADIENLKAWRDQKAQQLHQELINRVHNLIKEIKILQKELGIPIDETISLTKTETLEILRGKRQSYEKILTDLRLQLKDEGMAIVLEISEKWKNIMTIADELYLNPSSLPPRRDLSELTTFTLLREERDRLRGELEKFKVKQKDKLMEDINLYSEELEQLNKIQEDEVSHYSMTG